MSHLQKTNTLGLENINYAIVEDTRPMMYKMMKYWGKKPSNIFREYIKHYSKENEIVLDPFCGSGTTPIEAVLSGRKAIGIDLNPVAIFIIDRITTPLKIKEFTEEWIKLKSKLNKFEKDSEIFQTTCEMCKKKARVFNLHYDGKNPYYIAYKCNCDKKSKKGLIKKPDKEDLDLIEKSKKLKIEWWYPKDEFPNSKTFYDAKDKVGNHFSDLWTNRNLYILSYINNEIEKIENDEFKKFFKFAFASMLHLSNKMVSARDLKSERPFSGSWGRPAYLFPERHLEQNPFVLFERAIEDKQGLIKGKTMSNKFLSNKFKRAKDFNDLKNNDKNLLLIKGNILDMENYIEEGGVDYILTDPPYGDLVKYFDLYSQYSVWLKGEKQDDFFEMPYEEEIIAKSVKELPKYENLMSSVFKKLFKILKFNRYFHLTFHNSNPKIYDLIMKICFLSGFAVEYIQFQPNKRASESGVANPYGSAISDYYIRLRKPAEEEIKREGLNEKGFEKVVIETAKRVIARRGQPTELPFLVDDIITEIYRYGQYFTGTQKIKKILEKRLNNEFIVKEDKWWLRDPDKVISHSDIPLSDRIEKVVIATLKSKGKIKFEEVLQTLYKEFPNSLTPATDGNKVKRLLSAYATKTKDGSWILDDSSLKSDIKIHLQMIIILAQMGKKLGFDVWCADRSQSEELRKICLKDFPLKFPQVERVKQIDVVWLKDNEIKYALEVENSTAFVEALKRITNIPEREKVEKVIVMPKKRLSLLKDKMQEPMFADYFEKDNWKIMYYEDVERIKNKKDISDFDKCLKDKILLEKQSTLS